MKKGFTLVEISLVIGLLLLMVLIMVPVLANTLGRTDTGTYAARAVDTLREAQSSVMSGRNNARYGVHFETNKFVFFEGAAYSAVDPNNLETVLPGTITITSVTLVPPGTDIHFANHKGVPTETGSIVFTSNGGEVKTITLNGAGMIDVN